MDGYFRHFKISRKSEHSCFFFLICVYLVYSGCDEQLYKCHRIILHTYHLSLSFSYSSFPGDKVILMFQASWSQTGKKQKQQQTRQLETHFSYSSSTFLTGFCIGYLARERPRRYLSLVSPMNVHQSKTLGVPAEPFRRSSHSKH